MTMLYTHPIWTETTDGGYSGDLTVTVADAPHNPAYIFVDSDASDLRLMLTYDQAIGLAASLTKAAAETDRYTQDHPA